METKICTVCRRELPATLDYFPRDARIKSKIGLQSHCRVCVSAYHKARNSSPERKESERQRQIIWRENHRERHNAIARAYKQRNKETINSKRREEYWVDPEKGRQKVKSWRQDNIDKVREQTRRRRSRRKNATGKHTVQDIYKQYENQKGKCYYCGKPLHDEYHVDHIIPLSRGGSDGQENIVVACPSCNHKKGSKMPHEWGGSNRLL